MDIDYAHQKSPPTKSEIPSTTSSTTLPMEVPMSSNTPSVISPTVPPTRRAAPTPAITGPAIGMADVANNPLTAQAVVSAATVAAAALKALSVPFETICPVHSPTYSPFLIDFPTSIAAVIPTATPVDPFTASPKLPIFNGCFVNLSPTR